MRKKFVKLIISAILFGVLLCSMLPAVSAAGETVYIIPITGVVDAGQAEFVERSFAEAAEMQAAMVILEVDTPGGLVEAALEIRNTILQSEVPTTAFVKGGAISAGSLITIACEQIAMRPGATMGAAEPRVGMERADEKFVSYFAKEMAATAEVNGRRTDIAEAMVDVDREIEGLVEKGKLLTLTYREAQEYGYADYIVNSRAELLTELDLSGAAVKEFAPSLPEQFMRLVTNPYVAPILLTIGIAGIVIEAFTIGWGIAGTIGILSLALYFGGNLLAGFTGWEAVLLFLLGMILLAVEAFMPGFGVFGAGGIVCMTVSIVLAAPSWETGIISLIFAIVGTIVLLMLSFKILRKRKLWDRLILSTTYKKEDGYIPQSQDLSGFVGKTGTAYTPLRPSGTVVMEDGVRLDVVTGGEFIARGEKVVVVAVEGIRIVVKTIEGQNCLDVNAENSAKCIE
ncbi:MAG: nodulation protein NfeD [Clostridia bacterium]|nr:nodulation protein NfeD [Clostridia bacterium]